MSTPALHARKLVATTTTATISGVLDAIWSAVQSTVVTYSDGASRTFSGTGATGWTWARVQVGGVTEAVYGSSPTNAINQRVIIAGRSATPTPSPTMLSPETFLASNILVAHQKNAGTFSSWNSSTPFTSSDFSGYWRVGPAVTTFSGTITICIYETEETISVEITTSSSANVYAFEAGAMVDPETSDAVDAETDGRVYGMWTGGTSVLQALLAVPANQGQYWVHSTSIGVSHAMCWKPGLNAVENVNRDASWPSILTVNSVTRSGRFPGRPIWIKSPTGWVGRLRNRLVTYPAIANQRLMDGATNKGYAIAASTTTTGDTILMEY